MSRKILLVTFLVIASLIAMTAIVTAAGGSIEGVITDPKGALIKDAVVTVKNITTNQSFTATTDNQGHYKIEGMPAGTYIVTVNAKGFSEYRREGVMVEEGKKATIDTKLEIAPVDVAVTIGSTKANDDPVYQKLRQKSNQTDLFSDEYAVVNNLVLKRDEGTFTLRSGEIYFLSAIEERSIGAVFIGDGEFYMKPPVKDEQQMLSILTESPDIKEDFTNLVLRFTDKTFEEIKASSNAQMKRGGAQLSQAKDLYKNKENIWRQLLRYNMEQRTLMDIYKPQRKGFFNAFIGGKKYNKLLYRIDPISMSFVAPEQVSLTSYGESDRGIWASFHLAEEYKRGTGNSYQDRRLFDFTSHNLDVTIKGTRIIATDKVKMFARWKGERVIPFELFQNLRVSRVLDEKGNDLKFIQEKRDEDADFAVILSEPIEMGSNITLTIEYEGDGAVADAGGGNFFLIPRSSWYPNNGGGQFGDRATFEINFRYPKIYTLVGVGNLIGEEKIEGDIKVAKWSSGTTELAVAGFNYGKFKKKEVNDAASGYNIEFYANDEVPDELKAIQKQIEIIESQGGRTDTTLGSISTTGMANAALAEAQNSTRIFNAYFGKIPYNRLAMTQQPAANFGQAWPTLIFMPYTAFIDDTQRVQLFGIKGGTNNFWKYVGPHEVSHQWWGHTIGWTSYRDQWMSEGFAELSASLYVMFVRNDVKKFIDFWEDQRKLITEATPLSRGRKPYTVGPVTQGYRLNNAKTGSIARAMIYPKGAYILHMIRMMMYDPKKGDENFRVMMQDLIKTHYNTDISTNDFKKIVEKHIQPHMDIDKDKTMNWFFDQWVYGTEVPAYNFEYQITKSADGKGVINGRITQSGVSDNFAMVVPIYVDFGKGAMRLGTVTLVGNSTFDIKDLTLPQVPQKVSICAFNDVLATSIQNKKR